MELPEASLKNPLFLSLILDQFKSSPCDSQMACSQSNCTGWHSSKDLRRPFRQVRYSKHDCPDSCEKTNCKFSNTIIEQKYHPDNYKKRYCRDFIVKGVCLYGRLCSMAHSDLEMKIRPLHLLPFDRTFAYYYFKSEFCPFIKTKHERFTCVYAHNWQDYKRPYRQDQRPVTCIHWDRDKTILRYEDECPDGYDCVFCHGWKELEYHPCNYKKQLCEKFSCPRPIVCSFRHDSPEEAMTEYDSSRFYIAPKALNYQSTSLIEYFIEIEASYIPFLDSSPSSTADEGAFVNSLRELLKNQKNSNIQTDFFKLMQSVKNLPFFLSEKVLTKNVELLKLMRQKSDRDYRNLPTLKARLLAPRRANVFMDSEEEDPEYSASCSHIADKKNHFDHDQSLSDLD